MWIDVVFPTKKSGSLYGAQQCPAGGVKDACLADEDARRSGKNLSEGEDEEDWGDGERVGEGK